MKRLALALLALSCSGPLAPDPGTIAFRRHASEGRAAELCSGVCGPMGSRGMDWSTGRDGWLAGPVMCRCWNGHAFELRER